jgi:wyosine [tRNA(Phe)-imidazoG37] synthetase (radical SAM superfamily)
MGRIEVRKDLSLADFVMAKLDACSEEVFNKINRPFPGITFEKILNGIKTFKAEFKGKFALQIMFIEENKHCAKELAGIAREIAPDEVELNTPLRPCGVKPLSRKEMDILRQEFKGMNVVSVYDAEKKKTSPISKADTLRRRGMHD